MGTEPLTGREPRRAAVARRQNMSNPQRWHGSLDFIGINHYYSLYVNDRPLETGIRDYNTDMSVDSRGNYLFRVLIPGLLLNCS